MFGVGAELADEVGDDDAHPAAARVPTTMDRRENCLTGE
jgi:hypothetical protein